MNTINPDIRFLHNSAIDVVRWDQLISWSPNGRNYAASWYLDILNPNWHGLIYGNYDYIMPVPMSVKFGISYAFQPVFAQQLGIFPPPPPDVARLFIETLATRLRLVELAFNQMNLLPSEIGLLVERKNFIISLYQSYPTIRTGYSQHTRRYVTKAHQEISILPAISPGLFFDLVKTSAQPAIKTHFSKLKQIVSHALARKEGLLYGAFDNSNQVCAAAFFLKEKGRYTYLCPVSTPEGKSKRAMFALIDRFIADHAGQAMLLDFEGSEIEGIARFFAGFGAASEPYPHLTINRLPKMINFLKKLKQNLF